MSIIDLKKIPKNSNIKSTEQKSLLEQLMYLFNKDIQLSFSNPIDDKFKEGFYAELALLLSEGIDLKSAFTIILEETEKKKILDQLVEIKNRVINGEKLADAINNNKNFSRYEYYSISIGEESGLLIDIMRELSIYYQRKIKLKRQLSSALIYPSIVMLVAFGTIVFMLNFVVPMFTEVFKRFKGDLPYVTKLIIQLSSSFKSNFWILILLIIAVVITVYTQRRKDWFRNYTSQLMLRIPVLGELLRKIYLARFAQSLSLLLKSKVSIIRSLELVRNMINFYPIEVSIDPVKNKILKGDSMHISLSAFPIYNKKMISMVKVAEDVNKLDEMLAKIASQYSEETEHQIELFNKLLEPVLIVFLGLVVGFILIAMYLPLFQLGTHIGV